MRTKRLALIASGAGLSGWAPRAGAGLVFDRSFWLIGSTHPRRQPLFAWPGRMALVAPPVLQPIRQPVLNPALRSLRQSRRQDQLALSAVRAAPAVTLAATSRKIGCGGSGLRPLRPESWPASHGPSFATQRPPTRSCSADQTHHRFTTARPARQPARGRASGPSASAAPRR